MDPAAAVNNDYPSDSAYSPHIVNEQDQQEDTTAIQNGHHSQQAATATPPLDNSDSTNQRYNSPSLYQQQQPNSRPGSGMGGHQQSQSYSENRNPQQQSQPANKSSVVIKVGMVGDAQIGKTSLMVKYVEGSWDEDYIQTLGMCCCPWPGLARWSAAAPGLAIPR